MLPLQHEDGLLQLAGDLDRARWSADNGLEVAGALAESYLKRGIVAPMLMKLHDENSGVAAESARLLLERMHGIALDRLRRHGWNVIGSGSHPGALRFMHTVTGEVEEDPELPGEPCLEAQVLQSLATLAAPDVGGCAWSCDVVHYSPCCGNGFLLDASGCNHRSSRTVVDIVVQDEQGGSVGRLRQLHAGVFMSPEVGCHADFDLSLPAGVTLEAWHEVTAAGLALLSVACADEAAERPAVLVLGIGDGALPSFLRHYASNVQVDVVEPVVQRVFLAQRYFGLPSAVVYQRERSRKVSRKKISGGWRLHGKVRKGPLWRRLRLHKLTSWSRRVAPSDRHLRILKHLPSCERGERYAAVMSLGAPSWDSVDGTLDLPSLAKLLSPRGAFVLHADSIASTSRLANDLSTLYGTDKVTEFAELDLLNRSSQDVGTDRILFAGCTPPRFDAAEWCRCIQAPGGAFQPGVINIMEAQRSSVICVPNVLGDTEISMLARLAEHVERNRDNVEVRSSPPIDTWKVIFLQAEGFFEAKAPILKEKLASLARGIGEREGWLDEARAFPDSFNLRVAEYHVQLAPGPGLSDPHHYDMDSLVTVDIMLSRPGIDFEGGELSTLEADGSVRVHSFGYGEAAVFCSHKFHSVSPVTSGTRRVLVAEFWRGPSRCCPHRCRSLQPICPEDTVAMQLRRPGEVAGPEQGGHLLPFRWGGVEEHSISTPRRLKLFWQVNDMADGQKQEPTKENSRL